MLSMFGTFDLGDILPELQNYVSSPPTGVSVFHAVGLSNIMNLSSNGENDLNPTGRGVYSLLLRPDSPRDVYLCD